MSFACSFPIRKRRECLPFTQLISARRVNHLDRVLLIFSQKLLGLPIVPSNYIFFAGVKRAAQEIYACHPVK